jgi:DNA-3-methyladenine glycosylase
MTTAFLYQHRLPEGFYCSADVCGIAQSLLGKIIVTNFAGELTAARIVETEAYAGIVDRASHAYGGRRTQRTEIMYATGGVAYVYLCYGMHHLFNVATNVANNPHAVLIRAAEPLLGIDIMLQRTQKVKADFSLTRGPGNVSKALGIHTGFTGHDLQSNELFIADDGCIIQSTDILATPRIGVDYAGEDAFLPYRFIVSANKYVSGKKSNTKT